MLATLGGDLEYGKCLHDTMYWTLCPDRIAEICTNYDTIDIYTQPNDLDIIHNIPRLSDLDRCTYLDVPLSRDGSQFYQIK